MGRTMSLRPVRHEPDAAQQIATWFGCGLAPVAPGTVASAAAVAIAWAVHRFTHTAPLTFLVLAALLFWPGVWAAGVIAKRMAIEDPGLVVVDEVIGQWTAIAGAAVLNWKSWLAAFLLFRIFDVWKPPPVRQLEHLHGGLGIVADDVMAGVYSAIVMIVLGYFHLY